MHINSLNLHDFRVPETTNKERQGKPELLVNSLFVLMEYASVVGSISAAGNNKLATDVALQF